MKKNIFILSIPILSCIFICCITYICNKNYHRNLNIEKTKHAINQTIKTYSDTHNEIKSLCDVINTKQVVSNITKTIHDQLDSVNSLKKTIKERTNSSLLTEPQDVYVGSFSITAYTWTGSPMANGEYPYVGCAASSDIPIGTTIYIENVGTYVIKDICPTSGVIDLYMNTYDECINFGRRTANVYVI